MTHLFRLSIASFVGYLLGNLPSAGIVTRLAGNGHDLTVEGTGNPGAMNAALVLGNRWGAVVSAADIAKGAAAAALGRRIAGSDGANAAATAAVIGHCHPIGRRGGKGVATSIGQVIGTVPAYLPLDAAVAFGTTKLPWFRSRTRAGTHAGSVVWVAATTLWWRRRWPNPGGGEPTWLLPTGAAVSSAVIARRFAAEAARVEASTETGGPDEEAAA
jgi:glycerol-3-phosphate acyltransferase PlsY